jgi:lipopolysaccharide export LptBFGC system permease protein LptF
MRIPRTLSVYVMLETLVYCGLAFFLLTLVMLTQNLVKRLDELSLLGMTGGDLFAVVGCIIPIAVSYSIPSAFLIGILLSVRRFGADGEIRAIACAGISPNVFLFPYLVLGLCASAIFGWLLTSVEHESRRELVQLFKAAAARGAIFEPGVFRQIGPRLVFVEDRDRDGTLHGVMILDQSQNNRSFRIFADLGRFRFNEEESEIELELWDGDLHFAPTAEAPERYERVHFREFEFHLGVGHILGGDFGPVRPKQMTSAELKDVIDRGRRGDPLRELDQKDPIEYEIELHRRRALPFAPLLFAAVAGPIALATEDRHRTLGLLLVLIIAFGYYALAAAMQSAARLSWLDTGLATWTPNIIFAAFGLYLAARERRRIAA